MGKFSFFLNLNFHIVRCSLDRLFFILFSLYVRDYEYYMVFVNCRFWKYNIISLHHHHHHHLIPNLAHENNTHRIFILSLSRFAVYLFFILEIISFWFTKILFFFLLSQK